MNLLSYLTDILDAVAILRLLLMFSLFGGETHRSVEKPQGNMCAHMQNSNNAERRSQHSGSGGKFRRNEQQLDCSTSKKCARLTYRKNEMNKAFPALKVQYNTHKNKAT